MDDRCIQGCAAVDHCNHCGGSLQVWAAWSLGPFTADPVTRTGSLRLCPDLRDLFLLVLHVTGPPTNVRPFAALDPQPKLRGTISGVLHCGRSFSWAQQQHVRPDSPVVA